MGLIDGGAARELSIAANTEEITEVRMRIGRQLVFSTVSDRRVLRYVVTAGDVESVLARASDFSVYAVNDELVRGYLTRRGVRIGVAGEGVVEDGKLLTVKNAYALVLRIPHEILDVCAPVLPHVISDGEIKNLLVISPPGGGKTTMLRDLARAVSPDFNTLVIDERYELAASEKGVPTLDVGESEVVSGVIKSAAYENCVRAMSPDLIVTDEIFRSVEVEAIADIMRSGVKVFASVHGATLSSLKESAVFAPLVKLFDVAVTLGRKPVGRILRIENV